MKEEMPIINNDKNTFVDDIVQKIINRKLCTPEDLRKGKKHIQMPKVINKPNCPKE